MEDYVTLGDMLFMATATFGQQSKAANFVRAAIANKPAGFDHVTPMKTKQAAELLVRANKDGTPIADHWPDSQAEAITSGALAHKRRMTRKQKWSMTLLQLDTLEQFLEGQPRAMTALNHVRENLRRLRNGDYDEYDVAFAHGTRFERENPPASQETGDVNFPDHECRSTASDDTCELKKVYVVFEDVEGRGRKVHRVCASAAIAQFEADLQNRALRSEGNHKDVSFAVAEYDLFGSTPVPVPVPVPAPAPELVYPKEVYAVIRDTDFEGQELESIYYDDLQAEIEAGNLQTMELQPDITYHVKPVEVGKRLRR